MMDEWANIAGSYSLKNILIYWTGSDLKLVTNLDILSVERKFHMLSLTFCCFFFFIWSLRQLWLAIRYLNRALSAGRSGIPLGRSPTRSSLPFSIIGTGNTSMGTPIALRLWIVAFYLVYIVSIYSCAIEKNEMRMKMKHEIRSILSVENNCRMLESSDPWRLILRNWPWRPRWSLS